MDKIRCAVVGVGYLGKFHAQKYDLLPGAQLVAVCDSDKERCQEIAASHNVKAVYNYEKLIGKVDVVSIVTPTSSHHKIAKFFLENKIHVLVEKPITTTVAEAQELIDLAKQHNLKLQVGHLERFNPVLIALKEMLQYPLFIESTRLAPYKTRATDVSVILDLMIHDIDIVQYLTGSDIEVIRASGAPVLSKEADIVNARIEFESGCVANVTASRISFTPKRLIKIFQHDAYFSGDLQNKTLSIHKKGKNEMFPGIPEIVGENLALKDGDALLAEIESFLDAIVNDTTPLVTGEEGRGVLATAMQITQAVLRNIEELKEKM